MVLGAIEINLDPNILRVGAFLLAWHGVFTAVGIVLGVWLAARVMRAQGLSDDPVWSGALWAVPVAIVGARILYVWGNWGQFADNPWRVFLINEGGISVWGAVFGGILGGTAYAVRNRVPIGPFADACAAGLILGLGVGRIGDIINGEHHGTPTTLPWAVVYTHPDTLGERFRPVHLAVGYEMIWDLLVLGVVFWVMRWVRIPGVAFWLMLVLYAVGRFWTHYFRVDGPVVWGLREAQFIATLSLLVSVPALAWVWWRGAERKRREAGASLSPAGESA